ncbi:hypothetical protein MTR_8g093490 [Medicago truncatula]|uniref:Uncharacterized protein n=1 Tax=Medicago truncatula TaxID=3880 RepID=G7LE05_MEDTR|nr:hypothetical protein MTR_8g093490 [Medicago truncatula]
MGVRNHKTNKQLGDMPNQITSATIGMMIMIRRDIYGQDYGAGRRAIEFIQGAHHDQFLQLRSYAN